MKITNKETVEQAAERYSSQFTAQNEFAIEDFIKGAEWQAERMYSEEDMIEFVEWIANSELHGYSKQLYEAMIIHKAKTTKELLKIWFEQFSKSWFEQFSKLKNG